MSSPFQSIFDVQQVRFCLNAGGVESFERQCVDGQDAWFSRAVKHVEMMLGLFA